MSALSFVTDQAGQYVHWGVVLISVTNLLIIVAMVLVFFLALILPFGSKQDRETAQERDRQ